MKKTHKTPTSTAEPFQDRGIGMDELSRISGLSKNALYHLRCHRPSALPPPLTGDAYRNSAKYLLSTVQAWLANQQEKPKPPTEITVVAAASPEVQGAVAPCTTPPRKPRPGRKRG